MNDRIPPAARVEKIGDCTLYLADCREVIGSLQDIHAVITDPVWPNAPADMFPGCDDPRSLLHEALARLPNTVRRIVVSMRYDSDPRFLQAVPNRYPYFRTSFMPYVLPSKLGRT